MPEPIIRTEHLSRYFGTVKAVEDLSLEVSSGIVFGFLGPHGAGKTTILLLLGLLEPTTGQAKVLGFDARTQADEIRARSGALLEFAGLYERMSAQDNLDLYGRIYQMPAPVRRARIQELLTHLDLWDRRRGHGSLLPTGVDLPADDPNDQRPTSLYDQPPLSESDTVS